MSELSIPANEFDITNYISFRTHWIILIITLIIFTTLGFLGGYTYKYLKILQF